MSFFIDTFNPKKETAFHKQFFFTLFLMEHIKLHIILLFLWLFNPLVLNAQDPVHVVYTEENGFPTNNIYDLYQASDGKIWLTSDYGVSSWDGLDVKTFSLNSEGNKVSAFSFFIESERRIWVSTSSNELYYFDPLDEQIEFTSFYCNPNLKQAFDNFFRREYIRQIWSLDNKLYVSFIDGVGSLEIDKKGGFKFNNAFEKKSYSEDLFSSNLNFSIQIGYSVSGRPYAWIGKDSCSYDNTNVGLVNDLTKKRFNLSYLDYEPGYFLGVTSVFSDDNSIYCTYGKRLLIHRNNEVLEVELKANPINIFVKEELIYIATYHGIEIFNLDGERIDILFSDLSINSVLVDSYGVLWFCSAGIGVFKVPHAESLMFPGVKEIDGTILKMKIIKDRLLFFTSNKDLFVYSKQGKLVEKYSGVTEYKCSITSSQSGVNFESYFGQPIQVDGNKLYLYNLRSIKDSVIYRTGHRNILKYTDGHKEELLVVEDVPPLLETVQVSSGEIFVATRDGLYELKNKKLERVLENETRLAGPIYGLKRVGEFLLLRTERNGLVLFNSKDRTNIIHLPEFQADKVNDIEVVSDSEFWIATNRGFSQICLNPQSTTSVLIHNFGSEIGFVNPAVIDLEFQNDSVWLLTKSGLSCFNSSKLLNRKTESLDLLIDSTLVNDVFQTNREFVKLNERDVLEVYASQINFHSSQNITYEYRIVGMLEDWISSENGHFLINGLSSGNYELEFRSIDNNGDSSEVKSISVVVATPWFKSWWVILCYVAFGVVILILIIRFFQNQIRRKKDGEIDRLNLEMKVLIGQMNPHFTFNTINSIQSYIIENDKKKASDYLSNFAQLIRSTLDFSRREVISWKEEKKFIELYVALESQRFEKQIDLSFEESFVSARAKVIFPALLLQPIVENAIIYGINKSDERGEIKISIIEEGEYFRIKIVNSGHQYEANNQNNSHTSHGLNIIKGRLKLYNGKVDPEFLISKHEDPVGTCVSFLVKKIF